MDSEVVVGVVGGVLGAVGVFYGVVKKERRRDVMTDAKTRRETSDHEREEDETALAQWRNYAKDRDKQHAADMLRLEKRIAEQQVEITQLIKRERDCLIAQAEARVQFEHMWTELTNLRALVQKLHPDIALSSSKYKAILPTPEGDAADLGGSD